MKYIIILENVKVNIFIKRCNKCDTMSAVHQTKYSEKCIDCLNKYVPILSSRTSNILIRYTSDYILNGMINGSIKQIKVIKGIRNSRWNIIPGYKKANV